MKPTSLPNDAARRRARIDRAKLVLIWIAGIVLTPILLLYLTLLFMPIPLPFVRDQVRNAVLASLPPSASLQLGDMALALEGGTWPVLQFSPVVYTDAKSGAKVQMRALEVGFSPFRALFGQPGATITMVGPHLQVNQDLLGPRLANFQLIPDQGGGPPTVRVQEGSDTFPSVGISSSGLEMHGSMPGGGKPGLRSDNDWLIYNLEAMQQSLGQVVAQAQQGRFSRLVIRDGVMDMNDAVYGVFRQFTGIRLDLSPSADGKRVVGRFSADFGGRVLQGDITRQVNADRRIEVATNITNIDFSAFLPFINDPDSFIGIVGAGALSIDVHFDGKTGAVENGVFHTDLTGMDLRVNQDHFPIVTSIAEIDWAPESGRFTLKDVALRIGQSSAHASGVFALGLDKRFGPTVGMSIKATQLALRPNDVKSEPVAFDQVTFAGWSAPLYGALGIDRLEATRPGVTVDTKGRVDMLRSGLGFTLDISGSGASADDVKRLWPYFLSPDARNWFVQNVTSGTVKSADLKFDFPVGTVSTRGEDKPIPPNGISIDMVSTGVKLGAIASLPPVAIGGETHLQVADSKITVSAGGADIPTKSGEVAIATPAVVMDNSVRGKTGLEVSGELKGGIAQLVALVRQLQPQMINDAKLPLKLDALGGDVDLSLVSNISVDKSGAVNSVDYAANGTVKNFVSTEPIQGHAITDGQISFTGSQRGYDATGKAKIDGFDTDVKIDGVPGGQPDVLFSSTLDVKDLKKMGFDVSNFLNGQVRFVTRPMPDGTAQMAVDITDAALNVADLGISKAKGVPGTLDAAVKQSGDVTELSQIKLAFGKVDIEGSLDYDDKKGLQSADFSSFALSAGDKAQLSLAPVKDGFALKMSGEQLDLKPMLQRFFSLGNGSGGPQSTLVSQTLSLDLNLKRALGFYKTTAYNMQMQLQLRGSDIEKASLQAQFGGGRSVSITTNPTPDGKVMSVAFNDLGTLLRFANVYSRIEGGEGNLVMNTVTKQNADFGQLNVRNFALVNEANAAQILESHQGSRQLIANGNKLTFSSGHVDFVRRPDRIEVANGVLTGATVGGTMRGFIYTDRRQYDLVGTYVPLFGLNSVFQKLPLIGPLLGGRNGEGLIGVTFAIRGSLDHPDFQINPASLLAPGALRGLFEYRAKELPETKADQPQAAGGN